MINDRFSGMSYYDILEVSPNASREVLKAAYKSLIQRYHPDRNPCDSEAAARSVLILEAYTVLSDPVKRAVYNAETTRYCGCSNNIELQPRAAFFIMRFCENKSCIFFIFIMLAAFVSLLAWLISTAYITPQFKPNFIKGDLLISSNQPAEYTKKVDDNPVSKAGIIVPGLVLNLNVILGPQVKSAGLSPVDSTYVLSINTIDVVVGSFDSDRFVSLLNRNKEYVGRELAGKLASANYEMLVGRNGDRYLSQLILNSIAEITNTSRLEGNHSPYRNSVAQYGAVDVLLPDSFTIKRQDVFPITSMQRY